MADFYFDTHAHYDNEAFSPDRDELLSGLPSKGVGLVINPGCDEETSLKALALAAGHSHVYAAVGWHPHDADKFSEDGALKLAEWAKNKKVVAIGETGLDYHYDFSPREAQRIAFRRHMELATELSLPVIVHDREAHMECLDIVREFPAARGVFHCYSGSAEMALELIALGWSLSFTGVVTFKNARRALECIAAVPIERIMLETDCPYLAPEPFRGKRCDSSMLPYIAQAVAEVKGLSVDTVASVTTQNAREFFKI